MAFNLNVDVVYEWSGKIEEGTIAISETDKVWRIIEEIGLAGYDSQKVKVYNQCTEVSPEETVGEVFEENDTVSVFKEEEEEDGPRIDDGKNIRNDSTVEIRMVLPSWRKQEPIFVPGGLVKTVRIGPFYNKLEIYWKNGQDFRGENVYRGRVYELPYDATIHSLFIDDNGVYKVFRCDDNPHRIDPMPGDELIKYESDFQKPIGRKFKITVENTGEVPLCVVSGMSSSFTVSPAIPGGTEARITIRMDGLINGKFLFGPFSQEEMREGEVRANMFNAQEMMNGIKIQISRTTQGQIKAAMVVTDAKDPQELTSIGTKHYRDGDRITKRKFLELILPNTLNAAGSLAGAFIGK